MIGLIQSEKRVTYRTLNYLFGLDETLLDDIRKEPRNGVSGKVLTDQTIFSPYPEKYVLVCRVQWRYNAARDLSGALVAMGGIVACMACKGEPHAVSAMQAPE